MTEAPDNVRIAYAHYLRKGDPPHVAASKAAQVWAESSGNPTITGDGGKAFGALQWHPDRQKRLDAYVAQTNLNAEQAGRVPTASRDNLTTQLDFNDWELEHTEKAAGDRLKASSNIREANDAMLGSLRPAGYSPGMPSNTATYDQRMRYAQMIDGSAPVGDWVSPRDNLAAAAADPVATASNDTGLLKPGGWNSQKNDALAAMGMKMMQKGQGGQALGQMAQAPEEFRPQLQAPGPFDAYRKRAGLLGAA